MKFLLVDDDPVALDLLSNILIGCGYEDISCAQSGTEALRLIKMQATPFDCMMIDQHMPMMDGVTLCRTIRQFGEYQNISIMMITADEDEEVISAAFNAGATDYITKPFDVLELMKRIRIAEIIDVPAQARELALIRSGRSRATKGSREAFKTLEVDYIIERTNRQGIRDVVRNLSTNVSEGLQDASAFSTAEKEAANTGRTRPTGFGAIRQKIGRHLLRRQG